MTERSSTTPTTDQEIIRLLADRNQMWADRYVALKADNERLRRQMATLKQALELLNA